MKKIFLLLASIQFFSFVHAQDGHKIFTDKCGVCHTVGDGDLTGPDLKGVTQLRSKDWLHQWITSSKKLMDQKDTLALRLFDESGDIPMPDQKLTSAEIDSVLAYISKQSGASSTPVVASAPAKDTVVRHAGQLVTTTQNNTPAEDSDSGIGIYLVIGLGVIAILVVRFLMKK